ncbi:transporter associated domain-containing protein [Candidatus Tisiphia endosymbiont of Nemotelus uliginosus]|uniref:transporter associated domain-containing protein n=1 Tax=Candidatus Tisiphia endosymbiont of Nemotelus uliginosus TaxID=3077926 RepID=UPI0035C89A1B
MPRSSKTEDSSSSPSKMFMIKNFFKIFISWCSCWKTGDNFFHLVKKLDTNRKKMSIEEKKIFMNLLDFGHKTVEEVIIPRSDIEAIKLTASFDELSKIYSNKVPRTRTLVYNETLDNIVGFIHIKDLFKILATGQPLQLEKIIRKPIISTSSMKLIDLLAEMRKNCVQISTVIDEYGGTDGIVTIEDIIEEIVGPIDDEHDKKSDNDSFRIVNKDTIISNARVKVEALELVLGVELKTQEDEFDTIGGLVLSKIGNVPVVGTKININDQVELEVIDANPRALKEIKLKLKEGSMVPNNLRLSDKV